MPDINAIRSRATRTKGWLFDRARTLHGVEWLPLWVREHFARDVPALIDEVGRLQRANDILTKWYLESETARLASQGVVDAAKAFDEVSEGDEVQALAMIRRAVRNYPEPIAVGAIPQLPWSAAAGSHRTEVSLNVHPYTKTVRVRDAQFGTWSASVLLEPDVAMTKGLALLRAGLQARVLSLYSPTDPEERP